MWSSERPAGSALGTLLVTGCAALVLGCVEHGMHQARIPFDYEPVPAELPARHTEGAIWPGDTQSGSFLFFDEKARGVGDLLTVVVAEVLSAGGDAKTDVDSTRSTSATLTSDLGFQKLIAKPVEKLLGLVGIGDAQRDVAAGTQLNAIQADTSSSFEGDGSTERNGRFSAVITCRVVGVPAPGIFHIRGRRAITVNHETQWLSIEGLVRQEDIGIDNMVPSTKLAEAQLAYDGVGVLDDKQRPGFLARAFDWVYPF